MQLQSEAERIRRKDIIISEAMKAAEINIAEGKKQTEILKAEAYAEAVAIKAQKEREGLELISHVINAGGAKGQRVLHYIQKKRYYEAYADLLEKGNVTILPDSNGQSGGSSDVLAAVAMMMANHSSSGNFQGKNQGSPRNQDYSMKDGGSKNLSTGQNTQTSSSNQNNTKSSNSDGTYSGKSDSNDGSAKKAGAHIDWQSIQHFNDKTLDSERKR